eukprot:11262047-Alexandrium_andersonii.AAC.1
MSLVKQLRCPAVVRAASSTSCLLRVDPIVVVTLRFHLQPRNMRAEHVVARAAARLPLAVRPTAAGSGVAGGMGAPVLSRDMTFAG